MSIFVQGGKISDSLLSSQFPDREHYFRHLRPNLKLKHKETDRIQSSMAFLQHVSKAGSPTKSQNLLNLRPITRSAIPRDYLQNLLTSLIILLRTFGSFEKSLSLLQFFMSNFLHSHRCSTFSFFFPHLLQVQYLARSGLCRRGYRV